MDDVLKNRIENKWPDKFKKDSKDPNFPPIPYEPFK
jgi:hypothetical protein